EIAILLDHAVPALGALVHDIDSGSADEGAEQPPARLKAAQKSRAGAKPMAVFVEGRLRLRVPGELHLGDGLRDLDAADGIEGAGAELNMLMPDSFRSQDERVRLGTAERQGNARTQRDQGAAPYRAPAA